MQNLLLFGSLGIFLSNIHGKNLIFVFVGHQLKKKVELLVGNVIKGGQIPFLGDFFSDMMQFPVVQGMMDHEALKAYCT